MKHVAVEPDPEHTDAGLFRIVWLYSSGRKRRLREGGLDLDTARMWAREDRRLAKARSGK